MQLRLHRLDGSYAVCRLAADAAVPPMPARSSLFSLTRTADELSIVCEVEHAPAGARVEAPWAAFAVEGPLDFALTGVVTALSLPIADAGVGIFVVSTYDTDVVLIAERDVAVAVEAWGASGHTVLATR
jgi:uncharacterized protein